MSMDSHMIEGHVFSRRRRGYDPDEVDAIIARLTAALTFKERALLAAEGDIDTLAQEIQTFDTTVIADAERDARQIVLAAGEQAEAVLNNARRKADTYETSANALFAEAEHETRDLTAEIDDAIEATVSEQADILEAAHSEAEQVRQDRASEAEANARAIVRDAIAESDELLDDAELEAAARVEASRMQSEAVLRQARAEAEELIVGVHEDIARERSQAAAAIASMAAAAEALAMDTRVAAPETDDEKSTRSKPAVSTDSVIVLKPDGITIDLRGKSFADPISEIASHRHYTFAIPDGSGAPPASRALLNSNIATSNTRRLPNGSDPGSMTLYQRRGLGIRRRLQMLNES